MNKKIERQFQHLDAKLANLLADLEPYSTDQLQRKPTPTAWSVIQVLQHLLLVEQVSTKYVQKKLSFHPTLKDANLLTALRVQAAYVYNFLPIKLKAPSYVDDSNFSNEVLLSDIAVQWQNQRRQLHDYLSALPETIFQKEVYKNPVVGRLSLYGMLQFFEGHFDRHHKQIKKLLRG